MNTATLTVDAAFPIGPVRRRTFGSFVEHLGRCVYTGIYEPGHPTATPEGFRGDVLQLVRELGVSTVRYPGGNFVSGYRWEDGIGQRDQRPRRLDLAWHSTEPNEVGVDEFMAWARQAGVEPMMAVNLGTRGVPEALDLLEYCNLAGGTELSEYRRANGADHPYGVKMWCLGNEMDGPWQIGHKTPEEYGRIAAETGRAMRMMDPELLLVACGSSGRAMPTFGEWERVVLQEAWDQIDMVSAHSYYAERDGNLAEFLVCAEDMDRFITSLSATIDAAATARKSAKKIGISFDEWNVWYQQRAESKLPSGDEWPVAPPLLEDRYSVADAVVVGDLLITLLRHTDRVWAANQAQLVNVIAPIMTEPGGSAWKQTIFHPFALTSKHARGEVLRLTVNSPVVHSQQFGPVQAVDAVATRDSAAGELVLFLVNRSTDDAVDAAIAVPASFERLVEALTYHASDPYWQASKDDQSLVPQRNDSAQLARDVVQVQLPPVSWSMIRLAR